MNETERWLEEHFAEADAFTFYRDMFAVGELDEAGAFTKGKYTGIIVGVSQDQNEDGKPKIFRWTLTDELDAVRIAADSGCFCLCSPISYAGKQRTAENARILYAFVVDVDKMKVRADGNPVGIRSLWEAQVEKVRYLPKPTYIVSSGTGIHLYYMLEHPIPLYRDVVRELQTFKHELTRMVWNDAVCNIHSAKEVQYEGIYQGFRMVGTLTKVGGRARAFVTGGKVTMEYLNGFMRDDKYRVKNYTYERRGGLTLEKAKQLYPEWYERRILNNEPRGRWHVNRALYEWWRERIRKGATVGHRYYCLMTLAIYAQKCSYYDEKKNPQPVTLDELTRDMFDLLDVFEDMTQDEHNHFTRADVLDALEAFEDKWTVYPRAAIEYKSGITIPATKRNGQKQVDHLEEARAIRDIRMRRQGRDWRGNPSKREDVLRWQLENPTGTKAECARALGLSKPTVYKHWREEHMTYEEFKRSLEIAKRVGENRVIWMLETGGECWRCRERRRCEKPMGTHHAEPTVGKRNDDAYYHMDCTGCPYLKPGEEPCITQYHETKAQIAAVDESLNHNKKYPWLTKTHTGNIYVENIQTPSKYAKNKRENIYKKEYDPLLRRDNYFIDGIGWYAMRGDVKSDWYHIVLPYDAHQVEVNGKRWKYADGKPHAPEYKTLPDEAIAAWRAALPENTASDVAFITQYPPEVWISIPGEVLKRHVEQLEQDIIEHGIPVDEDGKRYEYNGDAILYTDINGKTEIQAYLFALKNIVPMGRVQAKEKGMHGITEVHEVTSGWEDVKIEFAFEFVVPGMEQRIKMPLPHWVKTAMIPYALLGWHVMEEFDVDWDKGGEIIPIVGNSLKVFENKRLIKDTGTAWIPLAKEIRRPDVDYQCIVVAGDGEHFAIGRVLLDTLTVIMSEGQ